MRTGVTRPPMLNVSAPAADVEVVDAEPEPLVVPDPAPVPELVVLVVMAVAVAVPEPVPEPVVVIAVLVVVEVVAAVPEPAAELAKAAHSVSWSCVAAVTSAAVQFAWRHARAADWKGVDVHTHVRSSKLEQPALVAALVTQVMMHWSMPAVGLAAAVVLVVLCAHAVRAAPRTRRAVVVNFILISVFSGDFYEGVGS